MGDAGVEEGWRVEKASVRGLGGVGTLEEEELGLMVIGNPV